MEKNCSRDIFSLKILFDTAFVCILILMKILLVWYKMAENATYFTKLIFFNQVPWNYQSKKKRTKKNDWSLTNFDNRYSTFVNEGIICSFGPSLF